MKVLALLSLSLAAALGMPPFAPSVEQNPVLTEDHSPLLRDVLPVQGHVVVDDPVPQVRLSSEEQQGKLALVPVDMKQGQNMVELEIKVKPESGVEQEREVKAEIKEEKELKDEPQIKLESHVKVEQGVKVESEVKAEPDVEVEQELKADPEVKVESDVNAGPEVMQEVKVDQEGKEEVNVEPEVNLNPEAELEVDRKPEVETEPELEDNPDFKVESEVKVELDAEEETGPEEQEAQEMFQKQMSLEEETETSQEFSERHIDMEGKYDMVNGPIMELEPLDDDNMFEDQLSNTELSEVEKSVRATFQNKEPAIQSLSEEEGLMREGDYVSHDEPIMELEPEVRQEQALPDSAIMDEGSALDIMGQPMSSLEEYLPNEEARMGMKLGTLTGEPGSTRQGYCPGVLFGGKCYQFFRGPKRAEDAEFFCQERFHGGHLASITSQYIHREVMSMILKENGAYTRTWIGGLRYLETGRFVWLDGSHWSYADWLSGEPNNTADVEDCVEVLAFGNGKFNDFTCWEPQAFICSFPYQ
uniref:titin homolog n=1 Tax=Scatophagus argus TaxID=75038 RepID=UPI001ED7DF3A|nr:titin homolog [Scatophagus argus]